MGWPPNAWREVGWFELMARYRKLQERRLNRQSAAAWQRHKAESARFRTRGAQH